MEPMLEDYFLPIKAHYSIEEINEMRDLTKQILYMYDMPLVAQWPMPKYPEDYIDKSCWEPWLRTYMMAGVPIKVMREYVERRKKEVDKLYGK